MNAIALISIGGTVIRQDAQGRYCLNDLHKAAGAENRHRPSLWIENAGTQELIAEIAKAGIPALNSVKGGNASGTYVVKELVYAYAMWISPRFHLAVIRAYDAMVTGQAPPAANDQPKVDVMKWAEFIANGLRLEGSARVGLFQNVMKDYAPEMVRYLPAYGVDAPRLQTGQLLSSGEGCSLPTLPVTALLKEHSVKMSAKAFNEALIAHGYLERMTRINSKGAEVHYMSVTPAGQQYGKNLTSAHNPRETQPHWYIERFPALLRDIAADIKAA